MKSSRNVIAKTERSIRINCGLTTRRALRWFWPVCGRATCAPELPARPTVNKISTNVAEKVGINNVFLFISILLIQAIELRNQDLPHVRPFQALMQLDL